MDSLFDFKVDGPLDIKTFQHSATLVLTECELRCLLLGYDGLLIKLDDSDKTDQANDSDNAGYATGSTCFCQVCSILRIKVSLCNDYLPDPSTVWHHTES